MSNAPEWELAHRAIVGLAATQAAHEHAFAKALLRAHRTEVWRALGMGSFLEYAERFAGFSPRQTEERLRVAVALEGLPQMDRSLADGQVHFSAVREISRVADSTTEGEWLAAAKGRSVREIEQLVAGRRQGDRPSDPPRPEARRHTVVLELSAEVYATYREAQAKVRRDSDEHLTEEQGLLLMARTILGGPHDAGRSSYQIAMTVCERCGNGSQDGRGMVVPVDGAIVEAAECDAQRLDSNGAATQDISPTTRRLVVRRQHGKCALPGCRMAIFTDCHHLKLRSEGGSHDEANLVLLCSGHHTAVHRGALWIEGSWSTGMTFRHADGSVYGSPENPRAAAVLADLHSALHELGFKEREVRWMVGEARPHVGAGESLELALRRALRASQQARSAPTAS